MAQHQVADAEYADALAALQDLPVADLAKLVVWPDGSAIELEDRDIHISVHGLMTAILPAMPPLPVGGIKAEEE